MGKDKDKSKEEAEKYPDLRYGPLDYSLSQITSYLSDEQKTRLQAFRESIPTIWPEPLTGIEDLFLSDATLCRYLRARDWNLGKAQKMIVETLKWRRAYKPWAITAEEVDVELKNEGKLYRSGFDKYQRPILIMKPRKDNTGNEVRDIKVKYLVYCLEKCIRAGETQDREKISLLIDYSKYSQLSGMSMIKMSLEVLSILSDHYPERLGTAWMVHASWSFTFFWKAISPFLDSVTKKKIFFISKLPELKEWIDDDVLEVEYGGNNDTEYSYETIKTRDDSLFPPYNEAGELVHAVLAASSSTDETGTEKKPKHKKHKKHKESNDGSATDSTSHAPELSTSETTDSISASSKKKKKKSNHLECSTENQGTSRSSLDHSSNTDASSKETSSRFKSDEDVESQVHHEEGKNRQPI